MSENKAQIEEEAAAINAKAKPTTQEAETLEATDSKAKSDAAMSHEDMAINAKAKRAKATQADKE